MRSLALHYGSIQIASTAGESRRISVSGLAKARLLWLFRNFGILEFQVLSKTQQQLVSQMWNSGSWVPGNIARRDVIGTIEAFCPQPASAKAQSLPAAAKTNSAEKSSEDGVAKPPAAEPRSAKPPSAKLSLGNPSSEQLCSEERGQPCTSAHAPAERLRRGHLTLRSGLRRAASWRAASILLLGAAMYLGPRYLPPKRPVPHQTRVATLDDQKPGDKKPRTRSSPEAGAVAGSTAKAVSAASAAQAAAFLPNTPKTGVPGTPLNPSTPTTGALGTPVPVAASVAAAAPIATPTLARDLPVAMAHDAAPSSVTAPQPRAAAEPGLGEKREVLIRVRVNVAGQPKDFEVIDGDQSKISAALSAARLWHFKPCAGREACEQVLKFTDYGDSSRVQRIK